jgi:hypothetical protein
MKTKTRLNPELLRACGHLEDEEKEDEDQEAEACRPHLLTLDKRHDSFYRLGDANMSALAHLKQET